ncbi:uncharacterized protein N7483_007144 [Penicillium malachiteum]|uniref:uncharacterized protein n=1 Tax=Penicillium malachiteum TaxID=1324776 RepID=UPI0025488C76|nr:uncharacterized protein N7483_007144 [Penicillium malachiteum]KAJ5725787.1 hypothetical protein N7483_007144 [Penicillium malachiteum]
MPLYIRDQPYPSYEQAQPYQTPAAQKLLDSASGKSTWTEETSFQTQDDGQYHPKQPGSTGVSTLQTPADGLYHLNQQDSHSTFDDCQCHTYQKASGETQVTPNAPVNTGIRSQSKTMFEAVKPQETQRATSIQSSSALETNNAVQNQSLLASGTHSLLYDQIPSSTIDATASVTSIQQMSAMTTSNPDSNIASLAAHKPSTSWASSHAAQAASISCAVILVVAFIAGLILFPLSKKRRLRKQLTKSKENKMMEAKPRRNILTGFKLWSGGLRKMSVMVYLIRPKKHSNSITVLPYFTSNDTLEKEPKEFIATVHDEKQKVFSVAKKTPTLITITDPLILRALTLEIYRTKTEEACKSPESMESPQEESNSSPRVTSSISSMSEGHSEFSSSQQTELSNEDTIYSPSSLDSPKIGNLLSANPSINNVYMVEMDFIPCKTGQLEIQQGQSLGISKIFENGWALGVRLDSPEAGLVPRSHPSASPIRQQVQCDEQRRSSKRHSLPQQTFNALSSRFYSWLAKDNASHDMPPV